MMNWKWLAVVVAIVAIAIPVDNYAELESNQFSTVPQLHLSEGVLHADKFQNTINLNKNASTLGSVLRVLRFRLGLLPVSANAAAQAIAPNQNAFPEILGEALNFPNPFRLSQGTEIGYELSKDMPISIHVYDIFGNLIFKDSYAAGTPGGMGTPFYNRLRFDPLTLGHRQVPSSVYFYLIIHDGKVLGRGKMMVEPE